MENWLSCFVVAGSLLLNGGIAHSTVSEYTEFFIPYERAQSGYVCLNRQIMEAEFGIPLASMMTGIFSATKTLHQNFGGHNEWKNINLLTDGSAEIPWKLNFDRYNDSGVYDYSFTLDMGSFSAQNGDSAEGRKKIRDTAKLAIIAIIKTAESMLQAGRFRIWIHFDNLPEQDGLSGGRVYSGRTDWPGWPYTSSSPLYRTYQDEMIGPGC